VASQVRPITKSHSVSTTTDSWAQPADSVFVVGHPPEKKALTALCVEFVAKPEEAKRAELSIPSALEGALRELDGYAGCLVMISNLEARLITAITFWNGPQGAQLCRKNSRWVNALLKPYMDRCLRSQTVFARLPSQLQLVSASDHETSSDAMNAVEFESDLLTVA